MKFTLKALLLAGIAAIALPTSAQAVTKVACVGNSITYGYGLNGDSTYPMHLQQILGNDYEVTNFGNSSKMFRKESDESYWKQDEFTRAYNSAPNIVVIELGTNDSKYFFKGEGSSSGYNYNFYEYKGYTRDNLVAEMLADYEALIDTFAHQSQAPKIYATLQPYAQNPDWGIVDTAIVNTINPMITTAANAKGASLIDLHTNLNNPAWLQADSVHPNAVGAKELAKIVASSILNTPIESSASVTSSSSGEPTTAIRTRLDWEEPLTDNVEVFDLNGNLVKRTSASDISQIRVDHPGTYIVRFGSTTRKLVLNNK